MQPNDLEEQKRDLIEQPEFHFEREKDLPPLATNLLSTLTLNRKYGTTLEGLVPQPGAGKSTLSSRLNSIMAPKKNPILYQVWRSETLFYHIRQLYYLKG